MSRITVTGLDQAHNVLQQFSARRLAAAKATAATRVALQVREEVRQEMRRVFDRPTPYTLNCLFVRPATAAAPTAEVWVKDDRAGSGTPAVKYLLPQVQGGQRGTKRLEVALRAIGALPTGWLVVPGQGARLDQYGNWSRGQIIQVLSQLRITLTAGYQRNMSFSARQAIAAQRRAGGRFFVRPIGQGKAPGIYQREFTGRNITPVALFVQRAQYPRRLDFDGIARTVAEREIGPQFARAVAESAARMQGLKVS